MLKHILEPADPLRVEQVSSALRQSDRATGPGGGERKAGMSSQVMLTAPAKTGQLVSGGVTAAARSVNVVDGRNMAHIGSDRMAFIGGAGERNVRSVHTCAHSSLERGEVAMGRVALPSPATVGDAAEREDARVGVAEAASAGKDIRVLPVAIRSPSRSVIAGQDNTVSLGIKAGASGKVSAVDQETDLHSPMVPFGEHISSSAPQDNPIGSSTSSSSSTSTSGDTNGEGDIYNIGVAAALAMDTEVLRSEIARYLGQESNREQRPRRRARQRNAPAPPVRFSLRLTEQEAMEDVAAVSLAKDIKLEEAEGMPAHRNAKRRRR
ncbi:hypothetical protein CFC21_017174 [Triticum aestivum]|uniref:Uncharacterized protein n=2 Tax=Triticum aestivum TaxID=4565 RepID=A0A9R1E0E3_WHEAT|nr:hypothetical protein CFC21_017174 [Triticum aestivum]